jgi:hypothetical protein
LYVFCPSFTVGTRCKKPYFSDSLFWRTCRVNHSCAIFFQAFKFQLKCYLVGHVWALWSTVGNAQRFNACFLTPLNMKFYGCHASSNSQIKWFKNLFKALNKGESVVLERKVASGSRVVHPARLAGAPGLWIPFFTGLARALSFTPFPLSTKFCFCPRSYTQQELLLRCSRGSIVFHLRPFSYFRSGGGKWISCWGS